MKFYNKKRVIVSIAASVVVFIVTGTISDEKAVMSGILGVFITLAVLLPKIWWYFLLDRVRELSRAIKDED